MKTFGFIGCGNMGGALASALSKNVNSGIFLSNPTAEKAKLLAQKTGGTVSDNISIASKCSYIILGVKPQKLGEVMNEISTVLKSRKDRFLLVSMAAGVSTQQLSQMSGGNYPIIRIMPNTAVEVGCGMTLYCKTEQVTDDEISSFLNAFSAAGMFYPIEQQLIDAGCAVSGCGPAFAYMFIAAIAEGGVRCGLSSKDALLAAAKTVEGAGKMVLETGREPEPLKNAVCSPGGSTVKGVEKLEKSDFCRIAADAVLASYNRTKELGGK